jgi:hypothetical protein
VGLPVGTAAWTATETATGGADGLVTHRRAKCQWHGRRTAGLRVDCHHPRPPNGAFAGDGSQLSVYIKPRTPRLNGKVERSHRIDAEEFYRLLDGVVIDDVNIFNARLKEWQDFYNYHRPHGGLDGHTPYERRRQKTQAESRV